MIMLSRNNILSYQYAAKIRFANTRRRNNDTVNKLRNANLSRLFEDVQTNSKLVFALLFEQVHLDNVTAFMSPYSVF